MPISKELNPYGNGYEVSEFYSFIIHVVVLRVVGWILNLLGLKPIIRISFQGVMCQHSCIQYPKAAQIPMELTFRRSDKLPSRDLNSLTLRQ
jgi:hypothetical protein